MPAPLPQVPETMKTLYFDSNSEYWQLAEQENWIDCEGIQYTYSVSRSTAYAWMGECANYHDICITDPSNPARIVKLYFRVVNRDEIAAIAARKRPGNPNFCDSGYQSHMARRRWRAYDPPPMPAR